MRFSIDQILAFITTVETGSFSAAARRLKKAQSAVSTAIMNLELDWGVTLFDRNGRYPVLTEEGRVLYRESKQIANRCEELEGKADSMASGIESRLAFAMDELTPPNFTLEAFRRFGREFPKVDLEIFFSTGHVVPELLQTGKASLGLMVPAGKPPEKLRYKLIANLERVAVARADHPLALKGNVTKADLEEHRQLVAYNREGHSMEEDTLFGRDCWRVDSYYVIWDLVRDGIGWAFLPDYMVAGDIASGRLKALPLDFKKAELFIPYYLVWIDEYSLGRAGQWLLKALSEFSLERHSGHHYSGPWSYA